ncbi:MAG: hypothetical protein J6S87_09325, partial [Bacteroidales bacterium]|nr:hypothetical protein [Bacteroidales bacterium]
MKANSTLSISGNASCHQRGWLAVVLFFLSVLFMPVGLKAQVAQPTITANADLSNLVCGQTVTLTASGSADDYFWYSDAGCTNQIGQGATYTFQVTDQPFSIYCKAAQVVTQASSGSTDFSYTGDVQTYSVPPGAQTLTLECWGAQSIYSSSSYSSAFTSGNGGYAKGVLNPGNIQTLYVYVGGRPYYSLVNGSSSTLNGGWNGGGGKPNASSYNDNGPGGGATDICLTSSAMTFSNYRYTRTSESYLSRLIVAGGGGGGRSASTDCAGGYVPGNTVATGSSSYYGSMTGAGTNSSNYIAGGFGYGSSTNNTSDDRGCGGGGWYGGGSNGDSYGGGGSSFVWCSQYAQYVPSGYTPTTDMYMTDVVIASGNQSMPSPSGSTETGHAGAGYARITYTIPEEYAYSSAVSVSASAGSLPAAPVVEVSNACIGQDAALTVANAVPGLNYGWWDNASCEGNPLHEGITFTIPNIQSGATYYVRAYSGTMNSNQTIDFSYTNGEQTWQVVPGVRQVRLEVWGAEGGGTYNSYVTGKGGYAVGELSVQDIETLYINVGGQGGTAPSSSVGWGYGGYNGGGSTYGQSRAVGAGGGATSIATASGLLSSLNNNRSAVKIVAGGGGGTGNSSPANGNHGGGLNGGGDANKSNGAISYTGYESGAVAGCGTQNNGGDARVYQADEVANSSAGSFGQGGTYYAMNSSNTSTGAGGGGWYGGGIQNHYGGGGGSSYIGGVTNGSTISGDQSFTAPDGTTETGHSGNGFARITLLDATPNCMSAISTVTVSVGSVEITDPVTPEPVCHNTVLSLSAPSVTNSGVTVNNYGWEISAGDNNWEVFSESAPVTFSQNGYFIRYYVTTNLCRMHSDSVQITVNDFPGITELAAVPELCSGDPLTMSVPTVIGNGSAIFAEGWQISSDNTNWENFTNGSSLAYSQNGFYLRYFATNGCGTSYGNAVNITVNPPMTQPEVTGNTSVYCGQTTTLTASSSYNSEHLRYLWYSDSQGQNLVHEGSEFTTPMLDANTTYYLRI